VGLPIGLFPSGFHHQQFGIFRLETYLHLILVGGRGGGGVITEGRNFLKDEAGDKIERVRSNKFLT
jgi:hypothetical protein